MYWNTWQSLWESQQIPVLPFSVFVEGWRLFDLNLDRGPCAHIVSEGCDASVFHSTWAENHLINVLNMLESAFLFWPICEIPSTSIKTETLSASAMTPNLRFTSQIFCNISGMSRPDGFWRNSSEMVIKIKKTAMISHSWSIWDSYQLTSCDMKTVTGNIRMFTWEKTGGSKLQTKSRGNRVTQRAERGVRRGGQNGSWFSQSALQHEWISIINCSVWAGADIKSITTVSLCVTDGK